MDFNDTPAEAAFRNQVREWLAKNASTRRGTGDTEDEASQLSRARAWQAKKAAAGYAAITWPKEVGGLGGTAIQRLIYQQEEAEYEPPRNVFEIGLGMCVPTLMRFGTREHRERYVRPALYGEEIWCQLFSEPSGGSDVAAARLRAIRDGDEWVLNGQKIWSSGAEVSDFGLVIARTDPAQPKHKGLTVFFLDMKSAGVTVRPIRQASGGSEFNEVFFTDVRVPDAQRLGDVNGGWAVALATLMFERQQIGANRGFPDVPELIALAEKTSLRGRPAIEQGEVRQSIANWWLNSQGLKLNNLRAMTMMSRGETPGPEFSISKLVASSQAQAIAYFMMDLIGIDAMLMPPVLKRGELHEAWFWGAALRIAGGTDEILKNILAERVLGLPPEIRLDKDVSFQDMKS